MAGCRSALMGALKGIKHRYKSEHMVILLSGGVDTAAVLEANSLMEDRLKIKSAVTVLAGEASDRPYASAVALRHDTPHHLLDVSLLNVLDMLPFCISTLKTFDGMTLRNSIVIALAMKKAKDIGATIVLTGDGADELLGGESFIPFSINMYDNMNMFIYIYKHIGYSYTWGTPDNDVWVAKRNELALTMNFSTPGL
jgi:asparagine synthase (glutamine-hydrolysing)